MLLNNTEAALATGADAEHLLAGKAMEKALRGTRQADVSSSAVGLSQILLGIFTILVATIATRFAVILIGAILAVRGGLDIYQASRSKNQGAKGRFTIGVVSIVSGVLLLAWPQMGTSVFSLFLAVLFIAGGFQKIISPFSHKQASDKFTVLTGTVSLLLGILLLVIWPVESFTLLGVLVGIEIMLNGMTLSVIKGQMKLNRQ